MSPDPALGEDNDAARLTVQLLTQIQADQARILKLIAATFELANGGTIDKDIPSIARKLWQADPPVRAWDGSGQEYWATKAISSAEDGKANLGLEFLRSLAPGGEAASSVGASEVEITTLIKGLANRAERALWRAKFDGGRRTRWGSVSNLQVALDKCKRWTRVKGRAQLVGVAFEELDDVWPDRWRPDTSEAGNTATAVTVTAGPFDQPFTYYHAIAGVTQPGEVLPGVSVAEEATLPICGTIYLCSISRQPGIIDLDTAAAILSLAPSATFLDGHASAWRERCRGLCYDVVRFQSRRSAISMACIETPGHISHGVLMFHLRSFIVVDPTNANKSATCEGIPGIRCHRERTAFQGFYDGLTLELVERRYSTALSMLPLDFPAGHFSLVSVADTTSDDDSSEVWAEAPGYERVFEQRNRPWTRYGLQPAGLYTGLAAMQLQICSFLECWERDWLRTIDAIDGKISVQLDVLENAEQLRKLVLKTKSDASVLYFKVLQLLGVFADSVQGVRDALEALPRATHNPEVFLGSGFYKTYGHTEDTLKVLDHNWDVVRGIHRDAAEAIQRRLDRSKNEVLGLRDGLFNVQSVVEAQKSFELNKYLFVFTIVTIVYLPPTFVASFFGMDIFNAETVPETQTAFWTLIKWFCAVTYVLSIIALLGTRLPLRAVAGALGIRIPSFSWKTTAAGTKTKKTPAISKV